MSIVARLDEVLGPVRQSPAQRGVNVTFERGGRWRTMHVVEESCVELSIAVPELDGYRLRSHLGPATVLGEGARVEDPRWRVKTDAPALALALFGEAPWPRGLSAQHGNAVADPLPLYALDLERGIASIERRDVEIEPARALGMVRRLLQVATWPDRVMGGLRDLAARLGGEVEGERWAPGTSAVTIRRGETTIRVDHELTRRALRTRVRVLDADPSEGTAYLDGVTGDAELVGRTIDALVAKVGPPPARGPYR